MKVNEAIESIKSCPVISCGACKNVEDGICGYCDIGEAIDSLKQTALAYREMLERLEWECNYTCKMCNGNKHTGHKPDCELAAMLKESEGLE